MISFTLFIFTVVIGSAYSADGPSSDLHIPPEFQVCKRNTPQINICLKELFQSSIPKFVNGVAALDMPPIDPYVLPEYNIDYKNKEFQVRGKVSAKDILVKGLKDSQIMVVSAKNIETDTPELEIVATAPEINVDGKYKLQGEAANIRVNGKGRFHINIRNGTAVVKARALKVERQGKTYVELQDLDIDVDMEGFKMDAPTFFNGNRELSQSALRMANQMWPLWFEYAKPIVTKYMVDYVKPLISSRISRIPLDEMLPPN